MSFFWLHDGYMNFFLHILMSHHITTEGCHARSQLASIGVGRQQALFATNGGLVDVYLNGPEICCMFFFWTTSQATLSCLVWVGGLGVPYNPIF